MRDCNFKQCMGSLQVLKVFYLHNNVFAHSTVTNDDDRRRPCVTIKGLDQINTYSELINTINTYRGTS